MTHWSIDLVRYGSAEVEAETLEEAMEKAENWRETGIHINDYDTWCADDGYEIDAVLYLDE